jgi:hypothetical protein
MAVMTDAEVETKAKESARFYEKGLEGYRRDVRLGLIPNVPFHEYENQVLYIQEAVAAEAQGVEFETEDPHDVVFHEPVRVERAYVE